MYLSQGIGVEGMTFGDRKCGMRALLSQIADALGARLSEQAQAELLKQYNNQQLTNPMIVVN